VRHRIAPFAWCVLAWNLAVVLWGAYVRASGSGAGCGAHWPLCGGEVIPRAPSLAKAIEFTHRATSGLALVAVAALAVAVFRWRPRGHPARRPAAAALALMGTEAALGAALVLFRLVAHDESLARALFMAAHLLNTFLLLAALALTAARADAPDARPRRPPDRWALAALGVLAVAGVSGAIAALGDTLHPAGTLREALAQDLSPTTELFVRLRIWHPAFAGAAAALVLVYAWRILGGADGRRLGWARAATALVLGQVALGFANVALLAPIPLQLAHLMVADAIWISVVVSAELRPAST